MDVIYLNEFKKNIGLYTDVHNIIFDDLNVMLYCNDIFYIDCYLEHNLRVRLNIQHDDPLKRSLQQTHNGVPFLYNSNFSEFDFTNCVLMFDDTMAYLDHISTNKGIVNHKVILVLKNIHLLSKSQQYVLSRLIEKLHRSFIIVLTTQKLSKIVAQLQSRLMCLNLNNYDLKTLIKQYIEENVLDSNVLNDIIKAEHVGVRSALLALHTGTYRNFVEEEMNALLSQVKKMKVIGNYIDRVREVIYNIMIFNIAHSDICKAILTSVVKKYKKQPDIVKSMVRVLAKLDSDLLASSKPLYHFEYCFLWLYKLVHST